MKETKQNKNELIINSQTEAVLIEQVNVFGIHSITLFLESIQH